MWKDIKGWEDYYKINKNGDILSVKSNSIKIQDKNSTGYSRITLQNKNNNPRIERVFVHRLVAQHFIPNNLNCLEVNHIDGDINNNNYDNLEWCDRKYNELHSRIYGEKEYKPFKIVYNDGRECNFNVKQDLADMLHVSRTLVKYWLHNKSCTFSNYGLKNIYYI